MKPSRSDDAVVDLLDVVLRDGVVVRADVVVTVADVPLVGIDLRAVVAGMSTMAEHGVLEGYAGTDAPSGGGITTDLEDGEAADGGDGDARIGTDGDSRTGTDGDSRTGTDGDSRTGTDGDGRNP